MKAPKDQHFLVDADAVALIADTVPVSDRKVLEIGPGGGVLTDALLQRGALVRAVELDGTLIPNLNRRFSEQIKSGQLEIIRGDASKVPLPEFELVVANLPYSISSKITFRLLDSVMAQTYAEVEMVLELPPEAFSPPPEVWSIVVKITPHEPPIPICDRKVHATLVRELFSHRRKTIRNGLRGMRSIYGEQPVTNLIATLPDELLEMRPEMLSITDFIDLANRLSALIP